MRSTLSVVATAALLTALGTAPAQADGPRTLTGPVTGDPDVFLTFVGCANLFAPAAAPQSRINLGPYDAPLGRRSLGLVPASPGTASGPFARFDSLASFDSTLAVAATSGSQGVSYVMSITPSNPPGTAWSGRAAVSASPGAWTEVSSAALAYDWTLVDLTTLTVVSSAGTATTAAFAAEHGDGAGFGVTGFGCDGQSFNLDAVRASGSTFDFEGVALSTGASVDRPRAEAGERVTISGRVTDGTGRVTGDPLVLESRPPGGAWSQVGPAVASDRSGLARVDVPVSETTEFRWHRPESQYADEGWSDPVTVTVEQPATAPAPAESDQSEKSDKSEAPAPQ
ncbi:hypothetical protein [Nocardioides alpinus]|uniref:hypothetical protein n=1 Tax=Nocardioides alpinus TaxID=748909 RepID=UPI0011137A00|nr:hypothetical protein [Nocardioides alpinus]